MVWVQRWEFFNIHILKSVIAIADHFRHQHRSPKSPTSVRDQKLVALTEKEEPRPTNESTQIERSEDDGAIIAWSMD